MNLMYGMQRRTNLVAENVSELVDETLILFVDEGSTNPPLENVAGTSAP